MALACGQERPRLSAGKALATDVGCFPAADASQKSLPGLGPGKSRGYAEVAVIRVVIPFLRSLACTTGEICEILAETTGTPTVQLAGWRCACAPNTALWQWILVIGSCPGGKIVRPFLTFEFDNLA